MQQSIAATSIVFRFSNDTIGTKEIQPLKLYRATQEGCTAAYARDRCASICDFGSRYS